MVTGLFSSLPHPDDLFPALTLVWKSVNTPPSIARYCVQVFSIPLRLHSALLQFKLVNPDKIGDASYIYECDNVALQTNNGFFAGYEANGNVHTNSRELGALCSWYRTLFLSS